ncbi:alpha/beta hydrolase [Aquamicrobium sp. LC103]|uniref:alpha/beta hydrolase n=1 Tax=Aquamicrobium sp. LC103 TaxID=1120658 RepID=UPI00069B1682|nr:alpha/beta hydrolase [Aquamicrobium sp. LC103]TKT77358.1 alpha/beta hydrolase [Aquamicrobium sp. LC103]
MNTRPRFRFASALVLLSLAAPAHASDMAATNAVLAASTALPAMKEIINRESEFIHRFYEPDHPSGRTMILMHGSGGDETTLVSLASKIAPNATLLGIRGRVVQNGVKRWYARLTPTEFDQKDIRSEAKAFATFLDRIADKHDLDLSEATFLGYSNGANLIAALTQIYPDLVQQAVLLRPMPVLSETKTVDLTDSSFLTIVGEKDKLYAPFAPKLESMLRQCGAEVDARTIRSGHGIGEEDARIAAEWLARMEGRPQPFAAQKQAISATMLADSVLSSPPVPRTDKGEAR